MYRTGCCLLFTAGQPEAKALHSKLLRRNVGLLSREPQHDRPLGYAQILSEQGRFPACPHVEMCVLWSTLSHLSRFLSEERIAITVR